MKDSRSRQGRIYPLWGILAPLILAAMHGEISLRGMWYWGRLPAERLVRRLDLWRYPGLSTIWYILRDLDAGILEEALRPWLPSDQDHVADGKVPRGSKRQGPASPGGPHSGGAGVRASFGAAFGGGGDELAAALALLEEVPLEGQVVSADGAIVKAPFVQKVVEKGGLHRAGEGQPTGSGGIPR